MIIKKASLCVMWCAVLAVLVAMSGIACRKNPVQIDNPLVGAVIKGDIVAVTNLIVYGADLNARDRSHFGWTPLIAAVYFEHTNIVEYLLSMGVDIGKRDFLGYSALGYAITSDNTNLAQLLLEHGAASYESPEELISMISCKRSSNDWLNILAPYVNRPLDWK